MSDRRFGYCFQIVDAKRIFQDAPSLVILWSHKAVITFLAISSCAVGHTAAQAVMLQHHRQWLKSAGSCFPTARAGDWIRARLSATSTLCSGLAACLWTQVSWFCQGMEFRCCSKHSWRKHQEFDATSSVEAAVFGRRASAELYYCVVEGDESAIRTTIFMRYCEKWKFSHFRNVIYCANTRKLCRTAYHSNKLHCRSENLKTFPNIFWDELLLIY